MPGVFCSTYSFHSEHQLSVLSQKNPDGQALTSFGKLDASKVPYFAIPESFYESQKSQIKPNSLGAIVYNVQMIYGIFGDTK